MSRVMNEQDHSRQLIDKAQAGDRAAIEELAQCYEGPLHAVVRAKLGPRLEARVEVEDIVQETLLRAFKSLSGFRWREQDSFIRWLSRIAGNVIHEVAKREKRDWVVLVEDPAPRETNRAALPRSTSTGTPRSTSLIRCPCSTSCSREGPLRSGRFPIAGPASCRPTRNLGARIRRSARCERR